MFNINDTVVCPGLGIGKVERLENREISGQIKSFLVIKLIRNEMKVLFPQNNTNLRCLSTPEQVEAIFNKLSNHDVKVCMDSWTTRHRNFYQLISTGLLENIAEVYLQLILARKFKTLCFGERKMLDQAENLLVQEIALVQNTPEWQVKQQLDKIYSENLSA